MSWPPRPEALLAEAGTLARFWAVDAGEAIKRRKPDFSEGRWRFPHLRKPVEEAQARGLGWSLGADEKSGAYAYRSHGGVERSVVPALPEGQNRSAASARAGNTAMTFSR